MENMAPPPKKNINNNEMIYHRYQNSSPPPSPQKIMKHFMPFFEILLYTKISEIEVKSTDVENKLKVQRSYF